MSQVNITINTDNEAFSDMPREETARILENLAYELKYGNDPCFVDLPTKINLRDYNGNHVGECKIIKS